jgi:antitoxin CptB
VDEGPTLGQLRWRCRRGTRELDLILLRFLSNAYEGLTPQERQGYARLLDTPDPELMAWVLGQQTPSDPEFLRLIQLIRAQSQPP